jgi:hypothetical protein
MRNATYGPNPFCGLPRFSAKSSAVSYSYFLLGRSLADSTPYVPLRIVHRTSLVDYCIVLREVLLPIPTGRGNLPRHVMHLAGELCRTRILVGIMSTGPVSLSTRPSIPGAPEPNDPYET